MAKQYFIPGDGMFDDGGGPRQYFAPGLGMTDKKSITGGWTINNMEVVVEMDNLTVTYEMGVTKWSMFLVM